MKRLRREKTSKLLKLLLLSLLVLGPIISTPALAEETDEDTLPAVQMIDTEAIDPVSSNFGLPQGETRSAQTRATNIDVYRIYNYNSGEHFYTLDAHEKDKLVRLGWEYEGVSFTSVSAGGVEVYRLYNPNSGEHFYTLDAGERNSLRQKGWRYEGVGWRAVTSKQYPVHRLFNPNDRGAGSHHYTMSNGEKDSLVKVGWRYEGVGWYSSTAEPPPLPAKTNWVSTYLGTNRGRVVNELTAHQNDRFYLTTPFRGVTADQWRSISPNGAPNGYGPGLNCTGFVAAVMMRSGGNLNKITNVSNQWGGAANGYNWKNALTRHCDYKTFGSVAELLNSGLAKKGDILYFEPDWSKPNPDCHLGIFWGDNPRHNRIWHSTYPANNMSNIRSGTPWTRIYLFRQG